MAHDTIQRMLLCPSCKCLPVHQRLYLCIDGHTICARCVTNSLQEKNISSCYSTQPELVPRVCCLESNAIQINIDRLELLQTSGLNQTYNSLSNQKLSEELLVREHQLIDDSSTTEQKLSEKVPDQKEYFMNVCCPSCGSPITKVRNLVAETITSIVANLTSFRSFPLECQRPAPPPSLSRPLNPTSMHGIVKTMLEQPSSIDAAQCQSCPSQRRYCLVPKLELNREIQSKESEAIQQNNKQNINQILTTINNPMDIKQSFIKKN